MRIIEQASNKNNFTLKKEVFSPPTLFLIQSIHFRIFSRKMQRGAPQFHCCGPSKTEKKKGRNRIFRERESPSLRSEEEKEGDVKQPFVCVDTLATTTTTNRHSVRRRKSLYVSWGIQLGLKAIVLCLSYWRRLLQRRRGDAQHTARTFFKAHATTDKRSGNYLSVSCSSLFSVFKVKAATRGSSRTGRAGVPNKQTQIQTQTRADKAMKRKEKKTKKKEILWQNGQFNENIS
jgi:hypothetical protein